MLRSIVTVMHWLSMALLMVLGAMCLDDLIDFALHPGSYPIGAEAAGIRYASTEGFVAFGVVEVLLAFGALAVPLKVQSTTSRVAIRVSTAVLLLAGTAWTAATVG